MFETVTGTMLADLVRHGTGAPPSGPLTTALIGSGASLLMTREGRAVGFALIALGGVLLWREAAAANRRREDLVSRARPAPAAPDRSKRPRAAASAAVA